MLHLADDVIGELVDASAAQRAVWAAFEAWGHGAASTTQRVRAISAAATVSAMAAVVPPYCGGKLYATADGRFTFVNVLFGTDGRLLATLDGDAITRLRTPAVSSLAIHHLAAPGAVTAALIGTGLQAWPHLEMLHVAVPELADVRICGRPGRPHAEALAARARGVGISAVAVDDPAIAVDGAQIIITVTKAAEPLFPAGLLADDALICAVGATKHDRAEIGVDVIERCATVVCDDVAGSRVECGDLIQAAAAGRFGWDHAVELHAIAAGTVTVARAGPAPVLFETQGVAIQDVAVAALAYERYTTDVPERSTA